MRLRKVQYTKKERRLTARLPMVDIVSYYVKDREFISETTICENISMGGLCVLANELRKQGIVVALKLHLDGTIYPIQVEGKVLWRSKVPYQFNSRVNYEVGLQFVGLDENNKRRLQEFIYLRR